jgi:hypothetical protein
MELDLNKFYAINTYQHSKTVLQGNLEENKSLLKKYTFVSNDYGFLKANVSNHIEIILT